MRALIAGMLILAVSAPALAQSSSIGRQAEKTAAETENREAPEEKGNPTVEEHSLIAVKQQEPKQYKIHDLITIIVRVQTQYEADGTTNNSRRTDLDSQLDAFLKFTGGGIGAADFRRGKPNITYSGTFNQRLDAESEREDRLTTRVTGQVVDIKPNGNLVVEAKSSVQHDDQQHMMTLTGTCRSIDITPDNTVLSTQVSDLDIKIATKGSIRNATRPGWLGTLVDWIRPL